MNTLPLALSLAAGWLTLSLTAPPITPPAPTGAQQPRTTGGVPESVDRHRGWVVLFDGSSTEHWRGYRNENFPERGWVVEDGTLRVVAGGGGGDIITREQYADFELELEWRVAPRANSGIMYRVTERHGTTWQTGPEYQILDDPGYGISNTSLQSSGALYDLYAPDSAKTMRPTGEFNHTRIIIRNGRVQHWLNGVKVVEADMTSDEWRRRIANSKFNEFDGFGTQPRGHIALQDHGNDTWFRNIRIRDLSSDHDTEQRLFDGRSLSGLSGFHREDGTLNATWRAANGLLISSGEPFGYIMTEREYTNFVLRFEWRWNPDTKATGNSGVLLRIHGEDRVWPNCVEAQLMHGRAGDIINMGGFTFESDPARTRGRVVTKTVDAERPAGEWNEYEIIMHGGHLMLFVNGTLVNEATGVDVIPGRIGFQSEGTEIHFRNIRIAPID